MASIRKRGSSYLIVVSMGYDYNGKRVKPQQKTVHPPEELTPKQVEKWLNEQAVLFERDCRHTPQPVQQLTLAKYIDLWLETVAPSKLAKSTIRRDRQDIERILPALGHYKLTELRPEHFRNFYAELRKVIRPDTKKPLSEYTIEGVHATLCSILSDAVEGGFLSHNPAWRTYRYAGRKCEKKIADEETAQKIIAALEGESIKYETYFKLIIATGMRRGECCALKWEDVNYAERSIHVCRNAVKTTGDEIIVKASKTKVGNRYVYFSAEMESLLREYEAFCVRSMPFLQSSLRWRKNSRSRKKQNRNQPKHEVPVNHRLMACRDFFRTEFTCILCGVERNTQVGDKQKRCVTAC